MATRKKGSRKRLLELALQGLRASAKSIQNEIVQIEHELRAISKGVAAGAATLAGRPARKRRRLSAAVRKAASLRMKAYWAKRRAARRRARK